MASAQEQQPQIATPYGTTAAPPPTPSNNLIATSAAADSLSRLLHRLPPTLSMPTRRPSQTTVSPPIISLSDPKHSLLSDLLSASELGFFQLTNHSIPTQLAQAAHSETVSLFDLPRDQKLNFPQNWPIGYDDANQEDENEISGFGSLVLDSETLGHPTELSITSLTEFTRQMEILGLQVVQLLSSAFGFDNPFSNDPSRVCSLMWLSQGSTGNNKPVTPGKFYPFVVGLEYQIRSHKSSILADSGWVSVSPQVDSVLVTLGDISQVWSNGKSKKVRGRPMACLGDSSSNSESTSMCLLVTLPLDSTVSPLLPRMVVAGEDEEGIEEETSSVFNSFSFEDYAWRVYHERLILKDILHRYRI